MYLKNDMKAKFVFLNDVEAAVGFTSTLMTQEFVGSTTIVPQVQLWDYTRVRCYGAVTRAILFVCCCGDGQTHTYLCPAAIP